MTLWHLFCFRTFMVVLLVSCLFGCSGIPKVDTDYNPEYNFRSIRTYYTLTNQESRPDPSVISSLTGQRIRQGIDNEMALRGINKVMREKSDIWVAYYVVTKDKARVTTYNPSGSHGWRRASYRYGYPYGRGADVDVRHYTEGSLIIDLVDPKTQTTVFRGISAAILEKKRSVKEREALVRSHVKAIFSQVPGFVSGQ